MSAPKVTRSSSTSGHCALAVWKACSAARSCPHAMHAASHALMLTVSTHPAAHSRCHTRSASANCRAAP